LKSKEEARGAVRDVIAILECQSGLKVKRLQSDNSLEFINSTMNKFCQRNGIIHETTLPYLPQQNGITKRAIAIIFKMVRLSQMVTYLICDLRKEFFKRVQARFR